MVWQRDKSRNEKLRATSVRRETSCGYNLRLSRKVILDEHDGARTRPATRHPTFFTRVAPHKHSWLLYFVAYRMLVVLASRGYSDDQQYPQKQFHEPTRFSAMRQVKWRIISSKCHSCHWSLILDKNGLRPIRASQNWLCWRTLVFAIDRIADLLYEVTPQIVTQKSSRCWSFLLFVEGASP